MLLCLRLVFFYFVLTVLWNNVLPHDRRAKKGDLLRLGWPVLCRFQPQSADCSFNESAEARFYFDITMKECMTFEYSDCVPSYNRFISLSECNSFCHESYSRSIFRNYTANIYCRYQPEFGDCNSYYPMFYFDISERRCKGFSYSGCGGNRNKFSSARLCKAVCSGAVKHPKHYLFMTEF
ncbi:tissue factor pathway inhibitor-like [Trichoplusia ni]|uniref:Tissue factor pathway inhibitor-like n=1 Tax=Trichoplusia ni TaxID=7111 RepID=A0A7E5VHK4_TRINI|nr:tissue factor pathway inhibitor-like [Trichoplusia ni]